MNKDTHLASTHFGKEIHRGGVLLGGSKFYTGKYADFSCVLAVKKLDVNVSLGMAPVFIRLSNCLTLCDLLLRLELCDFEALFI